LSLVQSGAGWIHPLAGQVIGVTKAAHAFAKKVKALEPLAQVDSVEALLAQAGEERPVLFLLAGVDRCGEAEQQLIRSLLLSLGLRIAGHSRILMFVGLGDGVNARADHACSRRRLAAVSGMACAASEFDEP